MKSGHQDAERLIRLSHFTIERAATAIYWVDSNASISRVNQAACQRLGYSMEELVGMTVQDISPDYPIELWPTFWEHLKREKATTFHTHHCTKAGNVFPVEIAANYIEFKGTEYCCTFVTDITERIRAEENLKNALNEVQKLKSRLQKENLYLQEEIKVEHNFEEIIAGSRTVRKMLKQIEQVAPTDATVLVCGETGTGKELVARAIHNLSTRRERALVKVNCAALPQNLIESELFGHEKGAFTGAFSRKTGRFELADGGTIFLDEIADMPLELQAKLLRILQEGEFERLGDPRTIHVDVRVLAATNRVLEEAIENGEFREDLYYRLNVFPINCPPLRDRKDDIPLLVRHFVGKYTPKLGKQIESIPIDVMDSLQRYDWPGNVRELENIIARAVIISSGKELEMGDWLSRKTVAPDVTQNATMKDVERQQKDIEREHILGVLEATGWRVSGPKGAARILGLKPTTVEARMKKLGINRKG